MRFKIIILCAVGVVAGGILLFLLTRSVDEGFQLIPQKVSANVSAHAEVAGTEFLKNSQNWTLSEMPKRKMGISSVRKINL